VPFDDVYHGRSTVTFAALLNDVVTIERTWCQWAVHDVDGAHACRLERGHSGKHEPDRRSTETQEIVVQPDPGERAGP
jgi:hypothetical protein